MSATLSTCATGARDLSYLREKQNLLAVARYKIHGLTRIHAVRLFEAEQNPTRLFRYLKAAKGRTANPAVFPDLHAGAQGVADLLYRYEANAGLRLTTVERAGKATFLEYTALGLQVRLAAAFEQPPEAMIGIVMHDSGCGNVDLPDLQWLEQFDSQDLFTVGGLIVDWCDDWDVWLKLSEG